MSNFRAEHPPIYGLPTDILLIILSHLSLRDIRTARLVNKLFHATAKNALLDSLNSYTLRIRISWADPKLDASSIFSVPLHPKEYSPDDDVFTFSPSSPNAAALSLATCQPTSRPALKVSFDGWQADDGRDTNDLDAQVMALEMFHAGYQPEMESLYPISHTTSRMGQDAYVGDTDMLCKFTVDTDSEGVLVLRIRYIKVTVGWLFQGLASRQSRGSPPRKQIYSNKLQRLIEAANPLSFNVRAEPVLRYLSEPAETDDDTAILVDVLKEGNGLLDTRSLVEDEFVRHGIDPSLIWKYSIVKRLIRKRIEMVGQDEIASTVVRIAKLEVSLSQAPGRGSSAAGATMNSVGRHSKWWWPFRRL